MTKPRFTIVTATAGAAKSAECFQSWYAHSGVDCAFVAVRQDVIEDTADPPLHPADIGLSLTVPFYLGPVPAFKLGVDLALSITAPDGLIACLHDDLLIEEDGWDQTVLAYFAAHPEVGLAGFGGGTGLGSDDIYQTPYNPMQLARQGFVSNMRDAEAHGRRSTVPVKVAALDGFSQVGRVAYWRGLGHPAIPFSMANPEGPFDIFTRLGIVHHGFDSALGALAHDWGWQVAMIPIACHHYGGQTAVADGAYNDWARAQTPKGDQGFWEDSHRKLYDLLRGTLPIRV